MIFIGSCELVEFIWHSSAAQTHSESRIVLRLRPQHWDISRIVRHGRG